MILKRRTVNMEQKLNEDLALLVGIMVGMYQDNDYLTIGGAIKATAASFLRKRGIRPNEEDYARINQYIDRAVGMYKKHFQL
jgi:hypothetical protein